MVETTTYQYDPMNRLTAYTIEGAAAPFERRYTYEGYNRKTEVTFEDGRKGSISADLEIREVRAGAG